MIGEVDVWSLSSYDEGIPQDLFTALRHEAPVYRHADPLVPEGHWAITRHADVQFVSRNPEIFSSHEKTCLLDEMPDEQVAQQQMMMINLDPPDHSRLRSLVNRGFTPRMIGKLREQLEKTCEGILDRALEKAAAGDSVEAVTEIASDLPLVVIADMMGVPQEDRHKLFEWSNRMVGSEDPDLGGGSDGAMEATMEVYAYAHNLGAEKRACPADDIVTRFVTKDEDGNELTELEFDMFFLLLTVAGNETTRNAITHGMKGFFDHPDQWELFKKERPKTATDEIIRWATPVSVFQRTALNDVFVGEQEVKKGQRVGLFYASGNNDESVFEDPRSFNVLRDPNPHLAFGGHGAHYCIGANLARLEVEVMFNAIADRMPDITRTGDAIRLRHGWINGIKHLPVTYA
jgi:cholest-4-en-3-one 26-monooxygenase